jgi:ribosomal protein S18 acetylase RimI-like enzyme
VIRLQTQSKVTLLTHRLAAYPIGGGQVKKLLLDLLDRSACVCLLADYAAGDGTKTERVGIVSLSFAAYSREENMTDAPPPDATYLSNMAVDLAFRRRGVATTLLAACDEVVR